MGLGTNLCCLGQEGTFSHVAALKMRGPQEVIYFEKDLRAVVRAVAKGEANMAIVPLENGTTGTIRPILDAIDESGLEIVAAFDLPIHHHLVGLSPQVDKVERVYVQREAHDQCTTFLEALGCKVHMTQSSHQALEALYQHPPGFAVAVVGEAFIGKENCVHLHTNIENNPLNFTRFVRVARPGRGGGGGQGALSQVLMGFSLKPKPKALVEVLSAIYEVGYDLQALHSRPQYVNDAHHYRYYAQVEVQAREGDKDKESAKSELLGFFEALPVHSVHFLGSW